MHVASVDLFKGAVLDNVVRIIICVCLQDKWMDVILHNESVEICEQVNLATLDIILQCAFSYKNNCQDSGYAINSYFP